MVQLSDALIRLGLTVWFDAALSAGTAFDEEIGIEISSASAVIVCWSKASVKSRWVRSEAMVAAKRGVSAPVFLEDCDLLPPFNLDHAEDLSDWSGQDTHEGWRKILCRLGALTGRGDALSLWITARSKDTVGVYREFLRNFSTDPLATIAKDRIWSLEMEATRIRLATELGISPSEDPAAELLQQAQRRAQEAEARLAALLNERPRSTEAKREQPNRGNSSGTAGAAQAAVPQPHPGAHSRELGELTVAGRPIESASKTLSFSSTASSSNEMATHSATRDCPLCRKRIQRTASRCMHCWMRVVPE